MKTRIVVLASLGAVTAGLLLATLPVTADSCNMGGNQTGKKSRNTAAEHCPWTGLEDVLEHIAAGRKAVDAGNRDEALAALDKAAAGVRASREAMRPAVVNTKCPIMGSTIDPDKVPANLYRVHKGTGIGFCCAGCPAKWDKLSNAEKMNRLKGAGIKADAPAGTCPAGGKKASGCCNG